MLFGEWLSMWQELYVDPTGLAENTKKCYHRAVRAVPDALRAQPLEQLSPLDLRRWLLLIAKSTPRAAQLDRVMLSRSLTIAAKLGLCRPGLVDPDVCPQIVHHPRKAVILNAEQLHRYMVAAAQTDVASVLLLCCCGCRRGEAMGARWQDLDLVRGTLTICVQRQDRVELPLKTAAAHRCIALPSLVIEALRALPRPIQGGWICSRFQQDVYRAHRRILAAEDLPHVTLHGLRHTVATLAAMTGEPIKAIQGALGHAHFAVTADLYADHLPAVCGSLAHDWKSCEG